MPTYRVVTLGCKLNQADSSAIETALRSAGLRPAPAGALPAGGAADLVILNTCTVTVNADREARQIARRLRRQNPGAVLIATGCFAERDPAALGALREVDHVVGLAGGAEAVRRIAAQALGLGDGAARVAAGDAGHEAGDLGPLGATQGCEPPGGGTERTRSLLKIQDGCGLRCSYCVIPSVRGASRSVPPESVLARLEALIAAGSREIVLTGVNTGDYGRDLDPPLRLSDLLRRAAALPGLGRLRLNSLEPRTVTPDVVEAIAGSGGRIAPHLQVPLQSGSDRVLARMRRPYRTADYARTLETLRREFPAMGIGADVIVGFPGEGEDDFESTCRFITASPLNYLHVFSYSPRPGTAAAALPDPVAAPVIRERSARLRALGGALCLAFRRSFIGRMVEVLTLREVRTDGRLRALSGNFIDLGLEIAGREPVPLMNRLLPARVSAATGEDTLASVV
jgi:threonylcarbamoyladenosine tRNA methylthiotransferase MtaB